MGVVVVTMPRRHHRKVAVMEVAMTILAVKQTMGV
jgi:hypothetical protein